MRRFKNTLPCGTDLSWASNASAARTLSRPFVAVKTKLTTDKVMRIAAKNPDLELLTLTSNSVFNVRESLADPPGLRFDRYATDTYDTIKRVDVAAGVAIFNGLPVDEREVSSRYAGDHRAASYLAAFLNYCAKKPDAPQPSEVKDSPRTGGQGFGLTPKERKAVEAWGMERAAARYRSEHWTVEVRGKPFDLLCTKATGEKRYVEVKASTGRLNEIIVTAGEIDFACENPGMIDLFLLEDVALAGSRATGGMERVTPWDCDRSRALPTHFRYPVER